MLNLDQHVLWHSNWCLSGDILTCKRTCFLLYSGDRTPAVIECPVHLFFPSYGPSCLGGSSDDDCALQWHVCGLIQDSVLLHELSLASEAAASPFDPSREIHLDYLI